MSSLIIHIAAGFLGHFVNAQALRDEGHRLDVAAGNLLENSWKTVVLLGFHHEKW